MWHNLIVLGGEKRCAGTTRQGRRCSITSGSDLKDQQGRVIAEPLRRGGAKCMLHMELFCPIIGCPAEENDIMLFCLDFESTGLDVVLDEVVEVGVVELRSKASFSTTVRPRCSLEARGRNVHGIDDAELMHGPDFGEMFHRMQGFLNAIVDNALADSNSDTDGDSDAGAMPLKFPSPQIVLVSHNGWAT